MSKSKILVLVTGSIAAYKACYLVSKLVQNAFEVKIAASKSALEFIGAASLEGLSGNKIAHDTFEDGGAMDHINLVRWADLIIAAPASANFINKTANGIGDDLISTLVLAHDFKKPFLICPAMNTQMYLHPATQKSIKNLREYGFEILETQSGVLACGEIGLGKLLDPDAIYDAIIKALGAPAPSPEKIAKNKAKEVLIISGGTIEPIDNVRAITNTSSGKTGANLAQFFDAMGADIVFLTAKNGARPDIDCETHEFTNFQSLYKQAIELIKQNQFDAIINIAAIADYSVSKITANGSDISGDKISSEIDEMQIHLTKNPKLIDEFKNLSDAKLVGFKLTSNANENEVLAAVEKQIKSAKSDFVIHNDLSQISQNKAQHSFHIYNNNGKKIADCVGVNSLSNTLWEFLWGK